ncbi:MAG: hypothetical protein WCD67_00505, partial [Xanthobacteraceae bacterium]
SNERRRDRHRAALDTSSQDGARGAFVLPERRSVRSSLTAFLTDKPSPAHRTFRARSWTGGQ